MKLTTPLYLNIAKKIESQILNGNFRAGEKLPSVRSLADTYQVALLTALEAYRELERRGFAVARDRSGFYCQLPHSFEAPDSTLKASVIEAPQAKDSFESFYEIGRTRGLIDLSTGVLNKELIPESALKRTARALLREERASLFGYDLTPGNDTLRNELRKRFAHVGVRSDLSDWTLTSGCLEAVFLAIRATAKPGKCVAVESPSFFGTIKAIQSLGFGALSLPTHPQTGMDLEALEDELRRGRVSSVIVCPSFQNPLGFRMSQDRMEGLLTLAEKYSVPLIEDDVFGELGFERPRTPLKSLDRSDWVILCSSFSKSLAGGLRVGFACSRRYSRKLRELKGSTSVANSTFSNALLAKFLQGGAFDRHLVRLRNTMQGNIALAQNLMAVHGRGSLKVSKPEGSIFLWIEMAPSASSEKLFKKLLRQKIAIAPGMLFSPAKEFQNCFRINLASPWSTRLEESLIQIANSASG